MAKSTSNPMMTILLVAVAAIGIYALAGGFSGDNTVTPSGDDSGSNAISGYEIVDDIAFTVKNRTDTLTSAENLNFYLTPHGQYADINAAFAAVQDSEVVSPFAGEEYSSAQTIAADDTITFTLAANNGQVKYYDIICIDTDTGVSDDYINTIETVGIRGKETTDGTESLQIVSDDETTITAFKQIKLELRGDVSILNDGAAAENYTIAVGLNESETDKVKTFTAGVVGEYTTANDISIYVEELSDVSGTCEVVLNDITINGKSVGFSEVTTTNFESRSAVWKNKPAATGTLYVLEDMVTLSKEAEDNTDKDKTIDIGINYDVDVSAGGATDAGAIKIVFVSFNGDVDSEQETETFTFNLVEDATTTGYDV